MNVIRLILSIGLITIHNEHCLVSNQHRPTQVTRSLSWIDFIISGCICLDSLTRNHLSMAVSIHFYIKNQLFISVHLSFFPRKSNKSELFYPSQRKLFYNSHWILRSNELPSAIPYSIQKGKNCARKMFVVCKPPRAYKICFSWLWIDLQLHLSHSDRLAVHHLPRQSSSS